MDNPGDSIVYEYDAAGIKLQQRVYQSDTLFKTTDYAGEFIYENGDLQFIQHEEGRIVPTIPGPVPGSFTYQYHLKDHLGNTRTTFTTGVYTSGYLATFEDATHAQDTTDFFNVDPRVPYPVGGKAVRLNSAAPIGPGFATAVSRGDTISMSVKAYYEDISGYGTSPVAVANIAAALTTAFGGVNGAGASDAQQAIYDIFNNDPAVTSALLSGNSHSDSYPSAYLNYLLFDTDNTIVDAGYFGVQEGANLEQTISVSDLVINQAGFIYIYLSNESASSNYVFFDNLDIAISESPVLETTDYYPFGLSFNHYEKPGTIDQRFKFQSQEHISDLGLNWDSFKWRNHQPDLGRFFNVDPLSEKFYYNSPYAFSENRVTSGIELEGLEFMSMHEDKQFNDLMSQVANGLGNMTFGTVGTIASGAVMAETMGAAAALGAGTAFALSVGEVAIGFTQVVDGVTEIATGEPTPQSELIQGFGSIPGLLSQDPAVDAAGQLAPALLSGGIGVIDAFKGLKAKPNTFNLLNMDDSARDFDGAFSEGLKMVDKHIGTGTSESSSNKPVELNQEEINQLKEYIDDL